MKQKLLLISCILCLALMGFASSNVSASSGVAAYYIDPGELYTPILDGATRYIRNHAQNTIFIPARTIAEQQSFLNNSPAGVIVFQNTCPSSPTITDSRDGHVYATAQIGTQCWMAENLNYNTGGSWCYANDPANCIAYGRLYQWSPSLSACPSGWKLPSDAEWHILESYYATETCNEIREEHSWECAPAGARLMSPPFRALLGGIYGPNGNFMYQGVQGDYWTAEGYGIEATYRVFIQGVSGIDRWTHSSTQGFSVRCLKE